MHFVGEETRRLMSAINREYAVPFGNLMALAGSAFTDGLAYAISASFPSPVKKDPAGGDG